MQKFTRISVVGFTAFALLLLTILVMAGRAWARESQDMAVVEASQETSTEFRQEAVTLSQPGAIQFLSGPNAGDPLDIALAFIQANREALGLSETDLADLKVTDMYQTKDTGVTHIYLRQRHNGIEVATANININIAADGSVINLNSRFVSNLTENVNGATPTLTAVAAAAAAARHLKLNITQPLVVEESLGGADQAAVLSDGGFSINPIPARLVYQPYKDGIRLAWDITIYQLNALHWWNLRVDANTGDILDIFDYVIHEDFLAQAKAAHGSISMPSQSGGQAQTPPSLLADTYRVYAWPVESPNYAVPAPPAAPRHRPRLPRGRHRDRLPAARPAPALAAAGAPRGGRGRLTGPRPC